MYRLALATLAVLVAGCGFVTDPALEARLDDAYQAAQAADVAAAAAEARYIAATAEAGAVTVRLAEVSAMPIGDQQLAALRDVATDGLETTDTARRAATEAFAATLAAWHAEIAHAEALAALAAADGHTSAVVAYEAMVPAALEAVAALEVVAAAKADEWDVQRRLYTALLEVADTGDYASPLLVDVEDAADRATTAYDAATVIYTEARHRYTQAKQRATAIWP